MSTTQPATPLTTSIIREKWTKYRTISIVIEGLGHTAKQLNAHSNHGIHVVTDPPQVQPINTPLSGLSRAQHILRVHTLMSENL